MDTVYIGGKRLIAYKGRYFAWAGRDAVIQLEWAENMIARPNQVFSNGRDSHEVAWEVYEKAEDELIEHYRLVL